MPVSTTDCEIILWITVLYGTDYFIKLLFFSSHNQDTHTHTHSLFLMHIGKKNDTDCVVNLMRQTFSFSSFSEQDGEKGEPHLFSWVRSVDKTVCRTKVFSALRMYRTGVRWDIVSELQCFLKATDIAVLRNMGIYIYIWLTYMVGEMGKILHTWHLFHTSLHTNMIMGPNR